MPHRSQLNNKSIADLNVAALHSFYKGDGRTATLTLLRAISDVLSSTLATKTTENNSSANCSAVNSGPSSDSTACHSHRHVSLVQNMTIATSCDDSMSTLQARRCYRSASISPKVTAFNQRHKDTTNSNDLYMYCKPFMIVKSYSDCQVNSSSTTNVLCHKSCVPEISAALLFNLALIHHIAGMRKNGSCGNSSLLRKALLCYDEALHHIRHCTSKVAVLVVAICNNRIHLCHHYFYDSIKGRQYLNVMNHALKYIESAYIPRKIAIGPSTGNGKSTYIHIFTDPGNVTQTISGPELHRFRLTHAFTKVHDFRLSPAA